MDEKTTQLIKERFNALPQSIQEVILSSHYEESLIEIGKQHSLNVEQLGILERETTLTMMGLTPTKDFESELARELSIDRLKVSQIVKDINEKIFLKIRELLKLMNTPIGEEPSIEEDSTLEDPKSVRTFSQQFPITPKEQLGANATIMKSAGIEILEKAPVASTAFPSKPASTSNPMLEQKMSKPFQIPMVQTEHSLDNLSKPSSSVPQAPKAYPKGGDPYRTSPEN